MLNQHIETKLQGEIGRRWDDLKIEFLFSVPTTWKPHPTVERFRTIVKRAGFGRVNNHTVDIGLTEAEAAAVHTVRESPASFNVSKCATLLQFYPKLFDRRTISS